MKVGKIAGFVLVGLAGGGVGFCCGRLSVQDSEPKAVAEAPAPRRTVAKAAAVRVRPEASAPAKAADDVRAEKVEPVRTQPAGEPSESATVARVKEVISHDEARAFVEAELANMWGEDQKKTAEGLRRLGALGRATLLACLRERIRLGSAQEREGAVLTVGALFGEEAGKMKKMVDDGKGSFSLAEGGDDGDFVSDRDATDGLSPEERAARQTKEVVKAISDGLSDADDAVRNAAYDAMRALAREEAGILEGQIFSGTDTELKLALLADAAAKTGEAGVMTSIAGLENEDKDVAAAAAKNLKAATGQDFKTEQQALDWWEKHGAE